MKKLIAFFILFIAALSYSAEDKPNVIIILADDLGYGDVSCYGATKIKTPNIDKLASDGLRFINVHATSATCTPSRYALLTGEYPWRKKGTGVLPGNASLIIPTNKPTIAKMFKKAGYATAVVGKWHLGLGNGNLDWNGEIKPGPLEIGFDYCFLLPATGDRVPCVFVENHKVVGLDPNDPIQVSYDKPIGNEPTGKNNSELLKLHPSHGHDQTIINGISRIGYMSGGKSARWIDEDIADTITGKAIDFIKKNKSKPFFLYFATHDIHVPRVPNPRFAGKTVMGARGDVILQLDWSVGAIVKTLEEQKLIGNTLIIFSSDNGPVLDDGYKDSAVELANGHKPAGELRGGKYSNFEGGTRIPLIVMWRGKIKSATSDAWISQIDLFASFAAITGQSLNKGDAPDSVNVLPALLGSSQKGRDHIVEHAGSLSIRKDEWKYITPNKGAKYNKATGTELGNDPQPQLYNLKEDIGEQRNLADKYPDIVKELSDYLQKLRGL